MHHSPEFFESHSGFLIERDTPKHAAYDHAYRDGYLIGRWLRAEFEIETLHDLKNDIEVQANTDDLTGLLRRNAFMESIDASFQKHQRAMDLERLHGILFMDLDDFGAINKNLGTTTGDECLRMTGMIIMDSLKRKEDIACRWGGEEFVVLLPDTELKDAYRVAERIQQRINNIFPKSIRGNIEKPLGVTIGVAEYQHGTNFLSSFNVADHAVSTSKKESEIKNQIILVTG